MSASLKKQKSAASQDQTSGENISQTADAKIVPLDSYEQKLNSETADPEVRAYIYQVISEFQPFITPETIVSVVAKDPKRLRKSREEFANMSREELEQYWRISITLTEDGAKLEAEAVDLDIFNAIHAAKEQLIKALEEIQDNVTSQNDRQQQIISLRQNPNVH